MIKTTIKGLRELNQTLTKLEPQITVKVADEGLKKGIQAIFLEADRLVPRRTGALRASMGVVSGKSAIKASRRAGNNVNDATRVALIGFRPPASRRAHLTEFGTRHSAAQPFLRPALDSKGQEAVKDVAGIMRIGIIRETRKLAKR